MLFFDPPFNGSDETVTTAAFTSISSSGCHRCFRHNEIPRRHLLKGPDCSLNTQTHWIPLREEPFKKDLWEFIGETSETLPCKVSWGARRSLRGRLDMYPDTWAVIQFREEIFHYETFSTRQNDSVWFNTSRLSNVDIWFQRVCMYFVVLTHNKGRKQKWFSKLPVTVFFVIIACV